MFSIFTHVMLHCTWYTRWASKDVVNIFQLLRGELVTVALLIVSVTLWMTGIDLKCSLCLSAYRLIVSMSVVSDALEIISESARHANDSMKKTVSCVLWQGRWGTVGENNCSLVLAERLLTHCMHFVCHTTMQQPVIAISINITKGAKLPKRWYTSGNSRQ